MATTDNEVLHNYLKTKIDMDGVIPDYMLPVFALQELRKQDKELAALREAGRQMAERLRENRSASAMANSTIQKVLLFSQKDAAALAEWEAANK